MSSPMHLLRAAAIAGLFAASLLSVVSAEGCIPTADTPCRGVNLECTDVRNVSHFLGDQPTVAYIEQGITHMSRNLSTNSSLTYRFDFTGGVNLSDIFPDTFETIHLPAIIAYELCDDYVGDYAGDLEEAIIDFLEMEANLTISILRCEFLYEGNAPPPSSPSAPSPPPSRKLLDITADPDVSNMYLFYGALDLTPDETYTVPTDHGVSSASVNGSITAPAIQPARRRLMQAGGVEEEGESLCRLSLKFRGYIAASYNNTKPWQQSNQGGSFSCSAEFREDYASGQTTQLAVSEACEIEDGLRFMEESCGPSPVKTLDDFPEIFPAGFDPVSEIMPTLQSHQPPSTPDFFPDAGICNSSPESLCDLVDVFDEETVQYMLSWFTPNESPSLTLLNEFYQAIC